jgi:hypothetical protein
MEWKSSRKTFKGSRYFQGCIFNSFGDMDLARKIGVAHAVACAAAKVGLISRKQLFN